ncbi:hypothetical protein [Microcoleus sp. B3-D7]|uniref:hypothetical protein n=1 Tax=Microcoleus sp. B3-D7 TaxID=2818659 RepID=UPI002FD52809
MLGNSEGETKKLNQQLEEVRSQLEAVQANPPITPVAEFKLPEPASALNLLKGKRKKSKTDLGDIEALWDILSSL